MAEVSQAPSFHSFYAQTNAELDENNFKAKSHDFLLLLISISVVMFFTLMAIYAWHACKRRLSRPANEPGFVSTIPMPTGSVFRSSSGLDQQTISSIPVQLYQAPTTSLNEDLQCSICLGGLVEGEKVKVLPGCCHTFHAQCVDQWLKAQSSCPLCRAAVSRKNVKAEIELDQVTVVTIV